MSLNVAPISENLPQGSIELSLESLGPSNSHKFIYVGFKDNKYYLFEDQRALRRSGCTKANINQVCEQYSKLYASSSDLPKAKAILSNSMRHITEKRITHLENRITSFFKIRTIHWKESYQKKIELGNDFFKTGATPAIYEIKYGKTFEDFMNCVRDKCDLSLCDFKGKTTLHWAIELGRWDIAKYLIANYPELVNAKTFDGIPPLHLAISQEVQLRIKWEKSFDSSQRIRIGDSINEQRKVIKGLIDAGAKLSICLLNGQNAFFYAYKGCSLETLKLLYLNLDPSIPDLNGDTPFHTIIRSEIKPDSPPIKDVFIYHINLLPTEKRTEFLINLLNLNKQYKEYTPPLHLALQMKNSSAIKALIQLYKENKLYAELVSSVDKDGNTLLHTALQNSKENSAATDVALEIARNYKGNLGIPNNRGKLPIHIALENSSSYWNSFIPADAASINHQDDQGQTPLYLAAKNDISDAISTILDLRGDVKIKDKQGNTPLHVVKGLRSQWVLLLHGVDVNAKNNDGNTPLHMAILKGEVKILKDLIKDLIQKGATNTENANGDTPLYLAVKKGFIESFKALINEIKTFKNEKNKDGYTFYHLIAACENIELAELFLKKYRDRIEWLPSENEEQKIKNLQNNLNQTPFHIAALNKNHLKADGSSNMIDLLLKYPIAEAKLLNIQDNQGNTVLHLLNKFENMEALIRKGADPGIINNAGYDVLTKMLIDGNELFKWLIERHFDPLLEEELITKLLHLPAGSSKAECMETLLERAAETGKLELVKVLCEKVPFTQNELAKALFKAQESHQLTIVEFICKQALKLPLTMEQQIFFKKNLLQVKYTDELSANNGMGFVIKGSQRLNDDIVTVEYNLKKDFDDSRNVVAHLEADARRKAKPGELILKYDNILQDPFLVDYDFDIDQAMPNPLTSIELLNDLIKNAIELVGDTAREEIQSVLEVAARSVGNKRIERRIAYLWSCVQKKDQESGLSTESRSAFLSELAAAASRCADGINPVLFNLESVFIMNTGLSSLGSKFSRFITRKKDEFLVAHGDPRYRKLGLQEYNEVNTQVHRLLIERMRLPLGMTGRHVKMAYPGYSPAYFEQAGYGIRARDFEPAVLVERFFNGGTLEFRSGSIPPKASATEKFSPLTVDSLVDEIYAETQKAKDGVFSRQDFIDFFANDPETKQDYDDFFVSGKEGRDPPLWDATGAPTLEGVKYALLKHGYLEKV